MQLTLDTLKETGAFTGRPVEKEIKWKGRDGERAQGDRLCPSSGLPLHESRFAGIKRESRPSCRTYCCPYL